MSLYGACLQVVHGHCPLQARRDMLTILQSALEVCTVQNMYTCIDTVVPLQATCVGLHLT